MFPTQTALSVNLRDWSVNSRVQLEHFRDSWNSTLSHAPCPLGWPHLFSPRTFVHIIIWQHADQRKEAGVELHGAADCRPKSNRGKNPIEGCMSVIPGAGLVLKWKRVNEQTGNRPIGPTELHCRPVTISADSLEAILLCNLIIICEEISSFKRSCCW